MKRQIKPELLQKLLEQSFTGRGCRSLSGPSVEALLDYTKGTNHVLQITEATMITPDWDIPMFEYCISGPLPRTGRGIDADHEAASALFREYDAEARRKERYAIRYDVWFYDPDQ